MRHVMRIVAVLAVVAFLFSTFALSGCAKHPSKEQLQTLEETKKAALAAEDQLAQKQQEKADLEKQLAEKKKKLDEAKAEKEAVQKRLQTP